MEKGKEQILLLLQIHPNQCFSQALSYFSPSSAWRHISSHATPLHHLSRDLAVMRGTSAKKGVTFCLLCVLNTSSRASVLQGSGHQSSPATTVLTLQCNTLLSQAFEDQPFTLSNLLTVTQQRWFSHAFDKPLTAA